MQTFDFVQTIVYCILQLSVSWARKGKSYYSIEKVPKCDQFLEITGSVKYDHEFVVDSEWNAIIGELCKVTIKYQKSVLITVRTGLWISIRRSYKTKLSNRPRIQTILIRTLYYSIINTSKELDNNLIIRDATIWRM
jgi:hypothetical protein